jgi:hypothetical protein
MIVKKCLWQIDHKLNTKTESENIISDIKTLRFTFIIKFASRFQHYKLVDVLVVDVLEVDQIG